MMLQHFHIIAHIAKGNWTVTTRLFGYISKQEQQKWGHSAATTGAGLMSRFPSWTRFLPRQWWTSSPCRCNLALRCTLQAHSIDIIKSVWLEVCVTASGWSNVRDAWLITSCRPITYFSSQRYWASRCPRSCEPSLKTRKKKGQCKNCH
jgi:hypothetical protein